MAADSSLLHVHSGMHKTGSSSIQMALLASPREQIAYIDKNLDGSISPNGNHANVVKNLLPQAFKGGGKYRQPNPQLSLRLLKRLRRQPAPHHVLSAEYISAMSTSHAKILLKALASVYSKVNHLCYIRDPYSYCVSEWQERLRYSDVDQRDTLLNRYKLKANRYLQIGRNHGVFSEYGESLLFDFSFSLQQSGCIVRSFYSQLNLPWPDLPEGLLTSNQALSRQACSLLYGLRRDPLFHEELVTHYDDRRGGWRAVVDLSSQILQGDKLRFASHLLAQRVDHSVIDAWLSLPVLERQPLANQRQDRQDGEISSLDHLLSDFHTMLERVMATSAEAGFDTGLSNAHQKALRLLRSYHKRVH